MKLYIDSQFRDNIFCDVFLKLSFLETLKISEISSDLGNSILQIAFMQWVALAGCLLNSDMREVLLLAWRYNRAR